MSLVKKPLVLIVDDVPENLQVLGSTLRPHGFQIAFATGGAEALSLLELRLPDLILLDIEMPEIDGFEVCRRIRLRSELADTPIIFLTARTETDNIVRGFEVGAVDYITKPFNPTELLVRVKTHLELRRSRLALIEANSALQEKNGELLRLHEEKNEFLGIVAHDLKNPITTVYMTASLVRAILNRLTPEDIAKKMAVIEHTSRRMTAIINNLLDVNALETGKMRLSPENFVVSPEIQNTVVQCGEAARTKNIQIVVENIRETTIFADKGAFLQIIDNLLSNALKYSPPHSTVSVRVE